MNRMGDFSLIPSAIVFGLVIASLVGSALLLRRRARRAGRLVGGGRGRGQEARQTAPAISGAPLRESVADLVKRANIQLVQMDDVIRAGIDELEFARAEFGEQSALEFAEALATAEARASEAFALKQRLDDSVPDTEQQQRDWSKRILALSDSATAVVTAQTRVLGERRRLESTAPQEIRRVRLAIAAARESLPDAHASVAEMTARYLPSALAAVTDNPARAADAFARAEAALSDAEARLGVNALTPIARSVQAADAAVREGRALLDAIARTRAALARAESERAAAIESARARLTEASRLRDTVEDADAAARIVEGQSRLEAVIAAIRTELPDAAAAPGTDLTAGAPTPASADLTDPLADIDSLDAATASLDSTLAVARTAQQRLDSARDALVGAVAIARSHIDTADDSIGSGRGLVGTDARTRLASARRELELAELESDPVAALDRARRAATLATDADALAHYDLRGSYR